MVLVLVLRIWSCLHIWELFPSVDWPYNFVVSSGLDCAIGLGSGKVILKMHLFLNVSVEELQNFIRKYYLIAELLIFKHR